MTQRCINRDFIRRKANLERSDDLQTPIPVHGKLVLFCALESFIEASACVSSGGLLVGSLGSGSPLKLTGEDSEIGMCSEA